MFKRYPHKAKIVISKETDNGSGIPQLTDTEIELIGRYEPSGQNKALDYKAKFYCKLLDLKPFEVDGQKLIYNDKQFKIVQLHNYQTHCEIWLE